MEGTIKFFNKEKQFGFITSDAGDVFFHESEIRIAEKLNKGDLVIFETVEGKKGLQAKNIRK